MEDRHCRAFLIAVYEIINVYDGGENRAFLGTNG